MCGTLSAKIPQILSGCKVALDEDRYTYRHDNVYSRDCDKLQTFLSSYTPVSLSSDSLQFVTAGSKVPRQKKKFTGIWHKACDWKLSFDYEEKDFVLLPLFYGAESLRFCFTSLCYQTKVTKPALKQSSLVAARSSFVNWMSLDLKT